MEDRSTVYPRSNGIFYPQIYQKFCVKSTNNNEYLAEEFLIQDLTEDYFDEAVEFMVENHARDAVFHRAAHMIVNESSIEKTKIAYRKVFEDRVSLICIRADTNEIVALNALFIKSKIHPSLFPNDDEKFRTLNESKKYIDLKSNIYNHYNVDRYVCGAGLCVHRDYRGRGIATELLRTRAALLRAIGLKVTSTVFSTVGAQKAAYAAGYDENFCIEFEDLEKLFPSMNFSHAQGSCCKVLSLKIE
jgi:GNAT superfamily N-acetyltransferase